MRKSQFPFFVVIAQLAVALASYPLTGLCDEPQPDAAGAKWSAPQASESDYNQLFFLQAGPYTPRSMEITNGDYAFSYGPNCLSSAMVQAGWALHVLDFGGSWYLEETLGFSTFSGSATSNIRGTSDMETLHLFTLPLDAQVMYAMDWFPWHRLIPFVDGGYQYAFYSQSGSSDLESAQGGTGNFTSGSGPEALAGRRHRR